MSADIKISELRLVINRILDHIENDLGIADVQLKQNDYWDVLERYDLTKVPTPSDLGVGKLSDDWEFLTSILDEKDHAVALMFIHVAPLLQYIGEEIGQ